MKYGRLTVVYEYPIHLSSYSNTVQASEDYELAIQEDLECLKDMSFSIDDLDADAQYVKAEIFEKEETPVAEGEITDRLQGSIDEYKDGQVEVHELDYEVKLDEDERKD